MLLPLLPGDPPSAPPGARLRHLRPLPSPRCLASPAPYQGFLTVGDQRSAFSRFSSLSFLNIDISSWMYSSSWLARVAQHYPRISSLKIGIDKSRYDLCCT